MFKDKCKKLRLKNVVKHITRSNLVIQKYIQICDLSFNAQIHTNRHNTCVHTYIYIYIFFYFTDCNNEFFVGFLHLHALFIDFYLLILKKDCCKITKLIK